MERRSAHPEREFPLLKPRRLQWRTRLIPRFSWRRSLARVRNFSGKKELKILDAAWADPGTNVIVLVAWGGVGKTAIVTKWLLSIRKTGWGGAERVFGWSFYNQGAEEGKQAAADIFMASALAWSKDPAPDRGTPWEKGSRLAALIKKQRVLLLLDGLEPMQHPPGTEEGRLRDQGLQCLLRELAFQNNGLCVITTRYPVYDIEYGLGASVKQVDLTELSPEAGSQLLRSFKVKGTRKELKDAVLEFKGHALALTLLGTFLRDACSGRIERRTEIGPLADRDTPEDAHARRVMRSYEKWFGEGPEVSLLRVPRSLRPPRGTRRCERDPQTALYPGANRHA